MPLARRDLISGSLRNEGIFPVLQFLRESGSRRSGRWELLHRGHAAVLQSERSHPRALAGRRFVGRQTVSWKNKTVSGNNR